MHQVLYVIRSLKKAPLEICAQMTTDRLQKLVVSRSLAGKPLNQQRLKAAFARRKAREPDLHRLHRGLRLQQDQKINLKIFYR
ncbi:MAG: hypothetical protein EBY25_09855 [Betaproteobacteria bacterium]|nr:hypothetical protein [Betaproteobacteria bacterium]